MCANFEVIQRITGIQMELQNVSHGTKPLTNLELRSFECDMTMLKRIKVSKMIRNVIRKSTRKNIYRNNST